MEYGPLGTFVKSVGWLTGSSIAVASAWRRRARWEPSEEDISGAPAKVGGLLASVALAIIWSRLISPQTVGPLTTLALWTSGITLGCLLAYGFLVAVKVYADPKSGSHRNIIGGLWLTRKARSKLKSDPFPPVSDLLSELGIERTWSRGSRALSKVLFVAMYLGLTVSGSVALTCAAGLVLVSSGKQYQQKPECYNHDFHNMRQGAFNVCAENWSQLGIWPNTLAASVTPPNSEDPDGTKTSEEYWFSGSFAPYASTKPFKVLLDKNAYLAEVARQAKSRFRPEHVSIVNAHDGPRFTAVWTNDEGREYKPELDLSSEQFTSRNNQLRSQGFVLTDLSVYQSGGTRLAAIWVKRKTDGYEASFDLPKPQFTTRSTELVKDNYQLTHVLAYTNGNSYLYGGIWEKNVQPTFHETDLTAQDYQIYYREQVMERRHPYQIVPYGNYLVASIWRD